MLSDLQTLLDRATGKEAETLKGDLRAAVRALWDRQFIYADDHGGAKPYELARRHRPYLESLFDAMGFDLVIDERERLVGILDQDGAAPRTLKLDETLFLLALRVIHAERIASFDLKERGRCDTTLGEVWTLIEERAQRRRPPLTRCVEIVRRFQRHGLVRALDDNGQDATLEIRPAIRLAMSEASLESLLRYAQTVAEGAGADAGRSTVPSGLIDAEDDRPDGDGPDDAPDGDDRVPFRDHEP